MTDKIKAPGTMTDTPDDSHGHQPPYGLIGRKFRHVVTEEVYEVLGVCWIGDTDDWGVMYSAFQKPVYVRSVENFIGLHETGEPRFEEVV